MENVENLSFPQFSDTERAFCRAIFIFSEGTAGGGDYDYTAFLQSGFICAKKPASSQYSRAKQVY